MPAKKTIFILEDDLDIRGLVRLLLVQQGYHVFDFGSAAGFYRALKNFLADLFILDVSLPDGNGLEIARNLLGDGLSAVAPIIMMSAETSHKAGAISSGAKLFLPKPFDIAVLTSSVSHLLAQ